MKPMKLRTSPTSPFARKCQVLALEAGLELELLPTSVSPLAAKGAMHAENPLGKIPVLITGDGEFLFDSRVICDYLDSLHGGPRFVPEKGPERRRVLRA